MQPSRVIELLYEALKHEYVVYVDDVLKSVGFLLVALGWLLTSETARKALQAPRTNALATACVAAVGVNLALVLYGHYLRSHTLELALLSAAPEMSLLIQNYAISPIQVAVNALALGALVALILLALRHRAS